MPGAVTRTADATFGFISSKPGSTFQCSLDGGAPAVCTSPTTYPALAPGTHTFTVTATDAAGNADPNPPAYTWTLLPPNVLAMTGGGCSSGGADLPALFALLALAFALRRRGSARPSRAPPSRSSRFGG